MAGLPSTMGNVPFGSSMLSRARLVLGPGAPRNGDMVMTSMPVSGDTLIKIRNRPFSKSTPFPT